MSNTMSSYSRTYNSFSGVDMIVTFNRTIIGELQGISFTVQREKAPIYTMGSADPRSFSRGKRGIAGSLIFMVFDRSALLSAFADTWFLASADDNAVTMADDSISIPALTVDLANGITPSQISRFGVGTITIDRKLAHPRYHDQILPFEVVITAANEYGAYAVMRIHGVEILNAGSGMSIDDITTDEATTFVARAITPWHGQGHVFHPKDLNYDANKNA